MSRHGKAIVYAVIFSVISILLSGCYLFPKEEEILAPPLIEPEITYDVIEVKEAI